jgi:hypothetical protein
MRLAPLDAEERAFFATDRDGDDCLAALAVRVGGALTAALGTRVEVARAEAMPAPHGDGIAAPRILPSEALIDCWISLRYGGEAMAGRRPASACFADSLVRLLARAFAETVVNLGPDTRWPPAMRLELHLRGQAGVLDVQARPEHLLPWASTVLKDSR